MLYTFNRFRVNQATGVREEVNVDEGFTAMLRFENEAVGLIEASKLATGLFLTWLEFSILPYELSYVSPFHHLLSECRLVS